MSRKFYGFEVYVGEQGDVVIKQDDHGEHITIFSPWQIEQLCDCLKEAAREAREQGASNAVG